MLKLRPDLRGSDTDQNKNAASTNDESQTIFPRAPTSKVLMKEGSLSINDKLVKNQEEKPSEIILLPTHMDEYHCSLSRTIPERSCDHGAPKRE